MGRIEERVAIVTGSAQGIGAAYAKALASEGASVVIADVDTVDTTDDGVRTFVTCMTHAVVCGRPTLLPVPAIVTVSVRVAKALLATAALLTGVVNDATGLATE